MKRYNAERDSPGYSHMYESDNGEYIKYDDIPKLPDFKKVFDALGEMAYQEQGLESWCEDFYKQLSEMYHGK